MTKKRIVIALCLMATATSVLAFDGGQRFATLSSTFLPRAKENVTPQPPNKITGDTASQRHSQENQTLSAQPPPAEIPKHIVYGILFREMAVFKKKAEEKEQKGEDAAKLRKHHQEKIKLNDRQFADFARVAAESDREVEKLDQKAKRIIDAFRAQHPDGKLQSGRPVAPAAGRTQIAARRAQCRDP